MSRIVVLLNAIHMPRVVHIELSLWMCSIPSLSTSNSKSLSLRTVLRSFWCSSHLALRTTWNTLVRQSSEVTPSWDPKVTCLSCARAKLGVLGWVRSRDIWFLTLDFGGLLFLYFLSKRFRQCQFGLPMCSREKWFDLTSRAILASQLGVKSTEATTCPFSLHHRQLLAKLDCQMADGWIVALRSRFLHPHPLQDGKNKSQWSYVRAMEAFEGPCYLFLFHSHLVGWAFLWRQKGRKVQVSIQKSCRSRDGFCTIVYVCIYLYSNPQALHQWELSSQSLLPEWQATFSWMMAAWKCGVQRFCRTILQQGNSAKCPSLLALTWIAGKSRCLREKSCRISSNFSCFSMFCCTV